MSYGGSSTQREKTSKGHPKSLAGLVATAAEIIGLLNKGSAKAPAASDAANLQPISSNALNVTRVGGVASLISAAGGAALLLFNVKKATDRASIVVAAYVSVGAIVVAALLTVAIIIAADIRARAAIATAISPSAPAENVKYVLAGKPGADGAPADSVVSLDRTYDYVIIDAAADMTLILPSADSVSWQQMTIKRKDNNGNSDVTVRPQGREKIFGQSECPLLPDARIQIYSNGRVWLAVQ